MKKTFILCLFLLTIFPLSASSKPASNVQWDGDFFIEKQTDYYDRASLVISRKYSVGRSYTSIREQHLFSYVLSCDSDYSISERITFSGSNRTNIDVIDLSIFGNDSLRFSANLNDSVKIDKLIRAKGFNVYSYGGELNGSLSLSELPKFLELHKNEVAQCKSELAISVEKKKQEKLVQWVIYGISGIVGFLLFIFIGRFILKKLRVAKSKTKELTNIVTDGIAERKNKKFERDLEKKVIETAVDEIVRQTVKRAMSEGVDPSNILICPQCKGAGCKLCSEKGWLDAK